MFKKTPIRPPPLRLHKQLFEQGFSTIIGLETPTFPNNLQPLRIHHNAGFSDFFPSILRAIQVLAMFRLDVVNPQQVGNIILRMAKTTCVLGLVILIHHINQPISPSISSIR
jgi:hypothetical protein